MTTDSAGQAGAHQIGEIEVTEEMIEAARLALIRWSEGVADFREGALHILEAGMLAGGERIDVFAGSSGSADEAAKLG